MDDLSSFQRRVTRIALSVLAEDHFALAGAGAIREYGLTQRPTQDIDLAKQAYTRQLKDSLQYATENSLKFDLYVRGGPNPTKLTGPLIDAIRTNANFNLKVIP